MNRAASEIPAVRVERQRKLEDLIRLRLAMMRDEEIDQMLAVNLRGAILLVREVVGAIDFLTSPRAAFITGQILPIDGGSS